MRESQKQKASRTLAIIGKLKRYYPDAHCALDHSSPLELLLATILSAQCTDERVNQVTKNLFNRFHNVQDYVGASLEEIEELIRPTGFFRSKAKSLKGTAERILNEHGGEVPRDLDQLTAMPGVGRKTANVVLG